jgi:hypothetical protein
MDTVRDCQPRQMAELLEDEWKGTTLFSIRQSVTAQLSHFKRCMYLLVGDYLVSKSLKVSSINKLHQTESVTGQIVPTNLFQF